MTTHATETTTGTDAGRDLFEELTATGGDGDGPDLFAEFLGLERCDFDAVAAVLPLTPLVGVPSDMERKAAAEAAYADAVARESADDDGDAEQSAPVVAAAPVAFFPAPSTMRLGGGWYFAALGVVYEVTRQGVRDWTVTPAAGGDVIARASSKADAVAAAWTALGAAWDVPEPSAVVREGRDRYGLPRRRLDITCEGQGLYLVRESRQGRGYWAETCPKCAGTGHINAYDHVDGGRCWGPCQGSGTVGEYDRADAVACVRRMAREERRTVDERARAAFRAAWRWDQFAAAFPDVAAWIDEAAGAGNDFAGKMRGRVRAGKELSERERAACRRAAGREALERIEAQQREAERVARVERSRAAGIVGERVTVTGTVARRFTFSSGPHYRPRLTCGVVVDDGAGVSVLLYSTAQAAFDLETGQRVTVTGEVKDPENRDRETGEIQTKIGGRLTFAAA